MTSNLRLNFLDMHSHSQRAWIVCITLIIGCIIRFYALDYQSLWNDELHSMNGASPEKTITEVIEYSRLDQPPLYFLLLHGWFKIFPFNETFARLLSAIFGVIGIAAMYLLGREIKNHTTGIIAAILTATNYFHILYSQEARFYSLLFLLSTLSFYAYIRCIKRPTLKNFGGYVAGTIAVLYTHYFGLVLVASQGIIFFFIVMFYSPGRKFILYSIASGVLLLILLSPWLPFLFSDAQSESFWIPPVKFPQFLGQFLYQYFRDWPVFLVCGLLIIYFIVVTAYQTYKSKQLPNVELFVLLAWAVLCYMIPYLYSIIKIPMLISRYTMIVFPAVLIVIALAIDSFDKRYIPAVITVFMALSGIRNLIYIQDYYTRFRNEQFREAAVKVVQENQNKNVIFSDNSWHFNYYLKTLKSPVLAVHPWEIDYIAELNKQDTLWVLAIENAVWEPLQTQLKEKDFIRKKQFQFVRAKAELYVKQHPSLRP